MVNFLKSLIPISILGMYYACSPVSDAETINEMPKIIFDTDFGGDADDLGALVMLHNLHNRGECELLAIMSWSTEEYVIPAMDAVNHWYGNPHIPMGIRSHESHHTDWNYTKPLADALPHKLRNQDVLMAVDLYREILANHNDKSITIVTVGPLANIKDLLMSKPDQHSSLNGKELIEKKVEKFVIMGGHFPSGEWEWNFNGDMPGVTRYVLENLTIPIVFSGFELGVQVGTGPRFHELDPGHPLYIGYMHFSEHASWMKDRYVPGKITANASYDQTAVLYAVRGGEGIYWDKVENGLCVADDEGGNKWVESNKSTHHAYLVLKKSPEEMADIIYSLKLEDARYKPRIIVTTDGETDDKASFLRFLLYTTDFDIEALIYTNSKWHLQGNGAEWMHEMVNAYARIYPNLKVHNPAYPEPEWLKSKMYEGQMEKVGREAVGEGMDTQGSDKIVEVLLDKDPRPIWLQAWGGLNNIAQALYRIKTSYPQSKDKAFAKAQIYAIAEQDDLKEWMHKEAPEVNYILNQHQFWRVIAYQHDRKNPYKDHEIYTDDWTARYVKDVNSFGAIYDRNQLEEGDTPAFLHFINTGLRSHLHPGWGGWGGRFSKTGPGNLWVDAEDDGDDTKPLWRFIIPIQEDFAARMQWSNTPDFDKANHAPLVRLGHPENLSVLAGQTLQLDASPTWDPNGDELIYHWWVYTDAGTFAGEIDIQQADQPIANLQIPDDTRATSIHVICEVKDKASFPITQYRRIILEVE
jgi:inosine-uridine nucleoside N-ribohydrolase